MLTLSDRRHAAFANPAKAACREGTLRVLREAAYSTARRAGTMILGIDWQPSTTSDPPAPFEPFP